MSVKIKSLELIINTDSEKRDYKCSVEFDSKEEMTFEYFEEKNVGKLFMDRAIRSVKQLLEDGK